MLSVLAGVLAGLCLLVFAIAPRVERALIYHPSGARVSPSAIGLEGVNEIVIPTHDGENIVAWYAPARSQNKTILYFHGNGASLAARAERIATFTSHGYGIFIMSYRGYSGSTGTPSERNNIADAKRAYDTLVDNGTPPDQIVLYGESLGTGVAIQVAAEKQVAGVILDAPYTSIVDVARVCYPYLPSRLLMRDRYETKKFIKLVRAPVLVIHGGQDAVVPVEMGREIAASLPGDTRLIVIPQAGHTDHYEFGSIDDMTDWLRSLTSRRSDSAAGSAA